jgi:hypothetical protein
MNIFKSILSRNIVLYCVLALVLSHAVNWDKCFHQRAKYLLGIFYNGYFLNKTDGVVYKDYLKRHGTNHEQFKNTL